MVTSYKDRKMKLCIGMPTPDQVDAEFACSNLPSIIGYTIRNLPHLKLSCLFKTGVRTDSNRNWILNEALKGEVDYILWLDTDQLYPPNIIERLLQAQKDIIGSIYYKRGEPYSPVVYAKNDNPTKPYTALNAPFIPKGEVMEVDGLGFGGLLVSTSVYKAMGDEKWMQYGKNFGIPVEMEDQESHDLIFCKKAQKYGFKLFLDTSIRCGHISRQVITEVDFIRHVETKLNPKIVVLMPAIDMKKADTTAKQLKATAGMNCTIAVLEDKKRLGYVAMINKGFELYKDANYLVYTAQDAYGGNNWLKTAFDTMEASNAGLLAFNDTKWNGQLASFGMVRSSWLKYVYDPQYLMFPGYKSHYGDTELSVIAKSQGKLTYNPNAVMMEVDYAKHGVNEADKNLFNERKQTGFDGHVIKQELLEQFS